MKHTTTISLKGIFIFLYSFFIFNIGITGLKYQNVSSVFAIIAFAITLVAILTNISIVLNKTNKCVLFLLTLYIISILVTAYVNKDSSLVNNVLASTIKYILLLFSIFFGIYILYAKGYVKEFLLSIFICELAYCLVNDIVFLPHFESYKATQAYMLGNKFMVNYAHINMFALYLINQKLKHFKGKTSLNFVCILYVLLIGILTDCITGIVGMLLFLLVYYLLSSSVIKSPIFWLLIFGLSSSVPFIYSKIILSNFYQNFILGFLGRNLTMTGRMNIYKSIPFIMYNHWTWGYGYGSSYQIVHGLISMPNMQNGLMELIVQTGIISSIPFFTLTLYFFYKARNDNISLNLIKPIMCLLYVYTVLSSIEITFSISFFTIVILGYVMLSYSEGKNNSLLRENGHEENFR